MASIPELERYIRFQLSHLRSLNKHHVFEDLARHFARLRICENILPATGPVDSGGDQGRDFETYRSYLTSTPIATSTFLGKAGEKKIVFACSLQTAIQSKIKSDVRTICGGTERIDVVHYFCETDLPVSRRHELQLWARDEFNAELEIFDGQVLSEQLADLDVFWIAEEYLDVPAEMYPRIQEEPTTYTAFKQRWLIEDREPHNYADLSQIKYGIRRATFHRDAKPDLTRWLAKMETFLREGDSHELRRRAIYEIWVAALRGQNNLTVKKPLVEQYFAALDNLSCISDLEDASALLSYCSIAQLKGHFEIMPETLLQWTQSVVRHIEHSLDTAYGPGPRCRLLQIRGFAGCLPFRHGIIPYTDPQTAFDETLDWWLRLLEEVESAPLFPLENFAKLLCMATPFVGEDPRFLTLTSKVDDLLSSRTGGCVAAEKCHERAMAYYRSGRYLLAIRQLHQAKIKWFSAETLRESLLAMLILSDCYQKLSLVYAAKYYSAIVAYLAFSQDQEDVKPVLPQGLFSLVDSCYVAGEWLSFVHFGRLALGAHQRYNDNPSESQEHEDLEALLVHASILRLITRRFDPSLADKIAEMCDHWPIHPESLKGLENLLGEEHSYWRTTSLESLWEDSQKQLCGRPFCDVGNKRSIDWRALGIEWHVQFDNEYLTTLISEEFVATLQILLAELGGEDLCLLSTKAEIQCLITEHGQVDIDEQPSNEGSIWSIGFPKEWIQNPQHLDDLRSNIAALALEVLSRCSMLSFEAFQRRLGGALSEGLALKIFAVRPYAELYVQFLPLSMFEAVGRQALSPLRPDWEFNSVEHPELAWIDDPGPGYSSEKAREFLNNRYATLIRPIRLTLPRLLQDDGFRSLLQKLKEEGYLDWQILLMVSNIAVDYRVNALSSGNTSPEAQVTLLQELMFREETEDDVKVPADIFTEETFNLRKKLHLAAVARTWELLIHRDTPDFAALPRLLNVLYNNSTDDIAHEDLFLLSN
jgi:hypothetical protein